MVHNDHLGTPQKMTDSAGVIRWSADYKPFGEVNITTNDITNNLRFPGQYYDAETGLNYNLNRDYNAQIGRYIEADPLGLSGGDVNLFRYVGNDPINKYDPDGLVCKNKKDPSSSVPWKGTKMPSGAAWAALKCIEKCNGGGWFFGLFSFDNDTDCQPYDLKITGGSECTSAGTHQPGSKHNSKHCTNQAFDLPMSANSKKLLCCAKKCGVTHAEVEADPPHLHFQTTGGGGPKNIIPSDKDCCSNK